MNKDYKDRLIEIVQELYENSEWLLKTSDNQAISLRAEISHLKGYVDALKEITP